MKQEKRFCDTSANQKTTCFRIFRPLLLRCLVRNSSGESGPRAGPSPVHLDLHRRVASVYSMELPTPRASVHNSVRFTNRNCFFWLSRIASRLLSRRAKTGLFTTKPAWFRHSACGNFEDSPIGVAALKQTCLHRRRREGNGDEE
jgi:hypothetical protein